MQDTGLWSNETVLNFIEEYRTHPVLWKNSKMKASELEKKVAWDDIENAIGINVDELKRKWGTIMSVYRKECHKVTRRSSPDEQYVPKWYCFEKLNDFLPFPKKISKKAIATRHKPNREVQIETSYDMEDDEQEEYDDSVSIDAYPEDPLPTKFTEQRDECEAFGSYLAEVLRKLDQKTRATIKKEIAHIIYMAETNEY